MDHSSGQSLRHVVAQPQAGTANTSGFEARLEETVEGLKATVHRALAGFEQRQGTADGAEGAIDTMLERVKATAHDTVARVKPTADLLDQAQQNPWLLMGRAILMGYILGSLASQHTSPR